MNRCTISQPAKRSEGKPFYVYMTAASNKFLRRYYAKVREYLAMPKCRQLHKRREETIERVFADAKEKHDMRYAQYRGLTQVTSWLKL